MEGVLVGSFFWIGRIFGSDYCCYFVFIEYVVLYFGRFVGRSWRDYGIFNVL